MSEIHAGRNDFSRGSRIFGVTMNIFDIHKRSFCFVLLSFASKNLTINSFNFYGSTIPPSWEYLDSSCTRDGPHNYIK